MATDNERGTKAIYHSEAFQLHLTRACNATSATADAPPAMELQLFDWLPPFYSYLIIADII